MSTYLADGPWFGLRAKGRLRKDSEPGGKDVPQGLNGLRKTLVLQLEAFSTTRQAAEKVTAG
jgi:hypothetical protein